jgi:hypothetical protein
MPLSRPAPMLVEVLGSIALVLGLGGLYVLLIAAIPIVLIVLVAYSIWQLRKPEGWEQQ